MQRLRQEGLPLPAALGLMAPWCDLRKSGDTLTTLTAVDPVLQVGGGAACIGPRPAHSVLGQPLTN